MSAEYYKRLERGNATGVSEAVIDGISRALQLDEAEHAHLYDLIRTANAGAHPQRRRQPPGSAVDRRHAADHRRDVDRAGLHPERPTRRRRDQPARSGAVLRDVMTPGRR